MTTETLLVGVATAIADTIDLHLPHSTPTHQLPINSIMHVGICSSNYTSIYLNCVFVHIKWMTNFAYVLHDLYVCACVCVAFVLNVPFVVHIMAFRIYL